MAKAKKGGARIVLDYTAVGESGAIGVFVDPSGATLGVWQAAKKAEVDPLSLLTRLCASVPPPRLHTVRYVGVLASASKLRPRIIPAPVAPSASPETADDLVPEPEPAKARGRYRPWAELLKRTFAFDVLACGHCGGRLRLVALVTEAASITRYLRALGEPTEPPSRAPPRGPPYWASRALRRHAGDLDAA